MLPVEAPSAEKYGDAVHGSVSRNSVSRKKYRALTSIITTGIGASVRVAIFCVPSDKSAQKICAGVTCGTGIRCRAAPSPGGW